VMVSTVRETRGTPQSARAGWLQTMVDGQPQSVRRDSKTNHPQSAEHGTTNNTAALLRHQPEQVVPRPRESWRPPVRGSTCSPRPYAICHRSPYPGLSTASVTVLLKPWAGHDYWRCIVPNRTATRLHARGAATTSPPRRMSPTAAGSAYATPPAGAWVEKRLAAVPQPSTLRGRVLVRAASSSSWPADRALRSAPLTRYWRRSRLVFSLLPRC